MLLYGIFTGNITREFILKSKTAIIAVVLVLLAVAGGAYFMFSKDKDSPKTTDNSEQSSATLGQKDIDNAVEVVEEWSSAYFAGDSDTACKLVTDNYTKQIAEQDDTPSDCKGQVDGGSVLAKAFGVQANEFTYSGRIENNTVLVTAKWSGSEGVDDYEIIKDGGAWKINAEIKVVSEEEKKQEAYNAAVEEWNKLSQTERDSWYNADGTGGFDAYAKSQGIETEY